MAKFESKTETLSQDKIEKLNDMLDDTSKCKLIRVYEIVENSDMIITRKSSRTKKQANKSNTVNLDEPEKKDVCRYLMFAL